MSRFLQIDPPDEETLETLSRLTATDWITAGSILVAAAIVGMILRALVVRLLRPRLGHLVSSLIGRAIVALFIAIGLVYGLNRAGVSVAPLLGLLGLLGLALALAFQDILTNFVAGVMLSMQRPFRVGEEVRTAGYEGTVTDVTLRSVTLNSVDGVKVIIPNSTVWSSAIENLTTQGIRRTDLSVGVGYDSDLDEVQQIIIASVDGVAGVADTPRPEALVRDFGDSSVNFVVRFWHEPAISSEWHVRDRIARRLKSALSEAGVEIPYPQVVVHRSTGGADDA